MLQFPYMGTKHALAPIVAKVAERRPEGPFLDAFAGMCSVATHVQSDRVVWTNDLQQFAVTAAKSMLCDDAAKRIKLIDLLPRYREHYDRLSSRFRASLRQERLMLATQSFEEFMNGYLKLEATLNRRSTRQFDLFTTCYANTYVGLEQAIEVDSLICAISDARRGRLADDECRRKVLFALGRTLLRVSTTTGHFAQFQTPSERNWKRFQRTRRASVMEFFEGDYGKISVKKIRTDENRAFNMDAVSLLRAFRQVKNKPSIVYADPPYKQDQYSRYYHLLETLVLYDYPKMTGKARYRSNRATSIFSSKARSYRGIEALSALTAGMGADLILSYPEDGIADIQREEMTRLLAEHFRHVDIVHEGILKHSTMGASKGSAKQPVIERIYLGQI